MQEEGGERGAVGAAANGKEEGPTRTPVVPMAGAGGAGEEVAGAGSEDGDMLLMAPERGGTQPGEDGAEDEGVDRMYNMVMDLTAVLPSQGAASGASKEEGGGQLESWPSLLSQLCASGREDAHEPEPTGEPHEDPEGSSHGPSQVPSDGRVRMESMYDMPELLGAVPRDVGVGKRQQEESLGVLEAEPFETWGVRGAVARERPRLHAVDETEEDAFGGARSSPSAQPHRQRLPDAPEQSLATQFVESRRDSRRPAGSPARVPLGWEAVEGGEDMEGVKSKELDRPLFLSEVKATRRRGPDKDVWSGHFSASKKERHTVHDEQRRTWEDGGKALSEKRKRRGTHAGEVAGGWWRRSKVSASSRDSLHDGGWMPGRTSHDACPCPCSYP